MLLVDNLGAWRDMPVPPGWHLVHFPGWDTTVVSRLIDRLDNVPVVLFSDLDIDGYRIHQHLRANRPEPIWFVPEFWARESERWALEKEWPSGIDLSGAPEVVQELARQGRWMEQERVAVDPRLLAAFDALTLGVATDQ